MAKKYDVKRVSRERLEQIAEIVFKQAQNGRSPVSISINPFSIGELMLEEAEVPLRTKSEVDADIAKAVRDYARQHATNITPVHVSFLADYTHPVSKKQVYLKDVFNQLLNEETSD